MIKCGSDPMSSQQPRQPGWALQEQLKESSPGFRLMQHVKCFSQSSREGGGGGGRGGGRGGSVGSVGNGDGEEEERMPLSVCTVQYSVDVGL